MRCPEYARLEQEVTDILTKLSQLTQEQLRAFRDSNHTRFTQLDKELEIMIGQKERSLGALRQHAKEHGCKAQVA